MRSATGVLSLGTVLAVAMATSAFAQDGRGEWRGRDGSDRGGWNRDGRDRGGWDRDDWGRHDRDRHDRHRHDRGGTRIIIGGGFWTGPDWGNRWNHWPRRDYYRPDPWVRYWRPPTYYGGYPWWYGRPRTLIVWSLFPPLIYDRLPLRARSYHEQAYDQAMAAPVGQAVSWNDAGTAGTITTTRDGYAGERYCREFQQNITVAGENQEAWGIACRQPDGSWQLVKQQE